MAIRFSKGTATVTTIFVIVLAVTWELGVVSHVAKQKEFSGTLTEKYRKRLWWKGIKKPMRAEHHYYDYFWVVTDDDGKEHDVEVLWHSWKRPKEGTPIKKELGERWPEIDTEVEQKAREEKSKAMEMLKDKITGGNE